VTAAEFQAAAVHSDLLYNLQSARRPLKAEHLFASVTQQAMRAVSAASEIISAAYSRRVGITHVGGDDELWSCMAAGALARLVLNQVSVTMRLHRDRLAAEDLLQQALAVLRVSDERQDVDAAKDAEAAANAQTSSKQKAFDAILNPVAEAARVDAAAAVAADKNKKYDDEYNTAYDKRLAPVKRQLDSLLTAWNTAWDAERQVMRARRKVERKYEASAVYKAVEAAEQRLVDASKILTTSAITQVEVFLKAWKDEATRALRAEGRAGLDVINPTSVLVQTARASERMKALGIDAAALFAATSAPLLRRIVSVVEPVRTIEATAARFQDQMDYYKSVAASRITQQQIVYAWAARRVDPDDFAEFEGLSNGSTELADRMAALTFATPASPTHYYCPAGNVLQALPGRVPFDVIAETTRILWVELLLEALRVLRQGVVVAGTTSTTNTMRVVNAESTGIGRHPLVVTERDPATITAFFSVLQSPGKFDSDVATPQSLGDALVYTSQLSNAQTSRWLRAAAVFARQLAFNADRFKHAIGLAMRRETPPRFVVVPLQTDDDMNAIAAAIGMATYAAELGLPVPVVALEVPEDTSPIVQKLEALEERCNSALAESGCKVVRVGEACLLAAQYA
jgi:hypothetical protein